MIGNASDFPAAIDWSNAELRLDMPNDRGQAEMPVRVFENHVPPWVESALEILYQNIYCSLARLRMYDSIHAVSTYLSIRAGEPVCVILFQVLGSKIRVLNQQISLGTDDIHQFCSTVFARYPAARQVDFYALRTSIVAGGLPFPYQQVPQIEENIAQLPASQSDYLKQMPVQSRGRMLKSMRKLRASFPSYEFVVLEREAIGLHHVEAVAALAAMRMQEKGEPPYLAHEDLPMLVGLARTYGSLGLIRVEGRIVAGNLMFRVGTRCFSQLIAHDPAFNPYGLGNQLQLQVILRAIDEGATEIWMMGGGEESKARFLTKRQMLNSITVYRSRTAALCAWRAFVSNEVRRKHFTLREAVKREAADNGVCGRALAGLLVAARAMKSAGRRARRFAVDRPPGQG